MVEDELEPQLEPSRRHPEGLPRCQRIIRREDEESYQCPRAARHGFKVCGMHGAGFATREARGERLSVHSNLRDGSRAKKETIDALSQERPTLRAAVEGYRRYPEQATDLRKLLAIERTLADQFTYTADMNDPEIVSRAFDMQCRAMKTAIRVATLEFEKGPVNPAEVDRFINAVSVTLASFVPSDQLEAAHQFLRMELQHDPDE